MGLFESDQSQSTITKPQLPGTASDQEIVVRKMGMPVEIEFAGKRISLKPGSAYTPEKNAKMSCLLFIRNWIPPGKK